MQHPEAPLRTLRPINSGGNCCNAAADEIALSITIKASLFPVIERDPLSTILVPPFTPPEVLLICKMKLYLLMIVQHLVSCLSKFFFVYDLGGRYCVLRSLNPNTTPSSSIESS
jgi:hypothetical protein